MNLQTQVNLVFLAVLLAVIGSMVFIGSAVIERIVLDLNTQLMQEQLDHVEEDIRNDYLALKQHGLLGIPAYREAAQRETLERFVNFRFGETGSVHIVTAGGKTLFPEIGIDQPAPGWVAPLLEESRRDSAKGMFSGRGRLWVYAPFQPWGWVLSLSIEENEILTQRNLFVLQVSLIGVVVLLGAWVGGVFLSRTLTRRIDATLACVREVERGKLSARVSVSYARDEIGQLQMGVNAMTATLAARIRDQEKAEQALRASETKYRRLHQTMWEAYASTDMEGRIRDFNQQLCDLIGYDREELLRLSIAQITPGRWHDFEHRIIEDQVRERGYSDVFEKELRRKDGSVFPVELRIYLLTDDQGGNVGTWAIIRDITERKQDALELHRYREHLEELVAQRTEALELANRELEAFVYSVSHDLRTPLRGMDGFSQALLEDYGELFDAKGKNYLLRIRNGAQYMAVLIDDLLELSRVSRWELEPKRLNLSELTADILDEFKREHPERSVHCVIAPQLYVYGDLTLMRQALYNLLQNAWKFTTEESEAVIEIGEFVGERGKGIYVRDNGAGFDMRYADRLFQPFQRLHSEERFVGTGVGLATVERVIHRHGGALWAEGEVGKGATFFLVLPDRMEKTVSNYTHEAIVAGENCE